MTRIADLTAVRAADPARIARALATRPGGRLPTGPDEKIVILAADHPARGALAVGGDPRAMADRRDLLDRCVQVLSRPQVHGFLGTADLVEDLALLGALGGKVVLGSMNRGGLVGTSFELDDRFTGYDAAGVVAAGLDGGKMLLRIADDDPASVRTMEACARAVDALAAEHRLALVEPFVTRRDQGRLTTVLTTDAVVRSVAIAAGLGRTSAYTWLKVPCVPQMDRVAAASTLPLLLLGGDPVDTDEVLTRWADALRNPAVRGMVIGRSLLYPPDGDLSAAVDRLVEVL